MITLRVPEYDVRGNIKINELADSKLIDSTRRVNRRATIDGGVFLDDLGFSHGDRTFEIKATETRQGSERIREFQQRYRTYECVTSEGVFVGTISDIRSKEGILALKFLVKGKAE